jgi:hypothetical protein
LPLIKFSDIRLRHNALAVIAQASTIINEYIALGYRLTLRRDDAPMGE